MQNVCNRKFFVILVLLNLHCLVGKADYIDDLGSQYQTWNSDNRKRVKSLAPEEKFRTFLQEKNTRRDLTFAQVTRLAEQVRRKQQANLPLNPISETELIHLLATQFAITFRSQIKEDLSGFRDEDGPEITVSLNDDGNIYLALEVLAQTELGRQDLARFFAGMQDEQPFQIKGFTPELREELSRNYQQGVENHGAYFPKEHTVYLDLNYGVGTLAIAAGHEIYHALDPLVIPLDSHQARAEDLALVFSLLAHQASRSQFEKIVSIEDLLEAVVTDSTELVRRTYPSEFAEFDRLSNELSIPVAVSRFRAERTASDRDAAEQNELEKKFEGAGRFFSCYNGKKIGAPMLRQPNAAIAHLYVPWVYHRSLIRFLASGVVPPPDLSPYSLTFDGLITRARLAEITGGKDGGIVAKNCPTSIAGRRPLFFSNTTR